MKTLLIKEEDFQIFYSDETFILSLKRNHKTSKTEENFDVVGHFSQIENAFKEVVKFRKGKKYPFNQSPKSLEEHIKNYLQIKKVISNSLNTLYKDIVKENL